MIPKRQNDWNHVSEVRLCVRAETCKREWMRAWVRTENEWKPRMRLNERKSVCMSMSEWMSEVTTKCMCHANISVFFIACAHNQSVCSIQSPTTVKWKVNHEHSFISCYTKAIEPLNRSKYLFVQKYIDRICAYIVKYQCKRLKTENTQSSA